MLRGEIWLVNLPASGGREQSGQRPALVIQDASYGQASPLVLCVMFSSQLAALRFPAAIRVDPTPTNGLSVPSIAMIFQARALDRSRFVRKVGVVGDTAMAQVLSELNKLTGQ